MGDFHTVRPLSVTIISVIAILVGLYSLIAKVYVVTSPEAYRIFLEIVDVMNEDALMRLPVEFHLTHSLAGSLVWIASGFFMLRGKNWARLLALCWGITVLVVTLLITKFSIPFYIKLITYCVMLYFLMRDSCSTYFHRAPTGS